MVDFIVKQGYNIKFEADKLTSNLDLSETDYLFMVNNFPRPIIN